MKQDNIRNFSIIAHIDHGKSTLADRILELTGAVDSHDMKDQLLDNMDLERERRITIKLNAVQLKYKYNNEEYLLNLIDSPCHVDFSYEVSRSLAACEGAILVVDAAQGIEAQTLANLYLAMADDLKIIPVINKIDLPNADIPKVKKELIDILGFKDEEIILCSGKTGFGVDNLIKSVITSIPSPRINNEAPTRALIFDSVFDSYRGVIIHFRVVDGCINNNDSICLMATNATYDIVELGINTPKEQKVDCLNCGEVGWLSAAIKDINAVHVGDTITLNNNRSLEPLPGYKAMKPMVYSGLFPIEPNKFPMLRDALDKLKLNDASLIYEPETSTALGFGFRCGFLGLLHMDVIMERIRREFDIDVIATSPSVIYKVKLANGDIEEIDSPNKMPDRVNIVEIDEPFIKTNIFVPSEYIGPIMELCQDKRGNYLGLDYIDTERVNIHYNIPLSEIVYDFFDKLKSTTKGYASFDYELVGYMPSNLVKMDILINGEVIDALSLIVHKDFAYDRGKKIS